MKKEKLNITHETLDLLLGDCRTPEDWSEVEGRIQQLKAALIERGLGGEMNHHLGFEKGEGGDKETSNRRNGKSLKTIKTDAGEITIDIPRDREGSFDPILVKKHQRRLPGFDDKVLALYARGLSMKEIQGYLHEIYGTEVSAELISEITNEVMAELTAWQNRSLESREMPHIR